MPNFIGIIFIAFIYSISTFYIKIIQHDLDIEAHLRKYFHIIRSNNNKQSWPQDILKESKHTTGSKMKKI